MSIKPLRNLGKKFNRRSQIRTDLMVKANLQPSANFKAAMRRADKYFSLYIRKSKSMNGQHCKCVTCGKIAHWKDMDCGHYMERDNYSTRYDEKNCNPQCTHCNNYRKGRQALHGQYIDKQYGAGTADGLIQKSKLLANFTKLGLDEIAAEYKLKLGQQT